MSQSDLDFCGQCGLQVAQGAMRCPRCGAARNNSTWDADSHDNWHSGTAYSSGTPTESGTTYLANTPKSNELRVDNPAAPRETPEEQGTQSNPWGNPWSNPTEGNPWSNSLEPTKRTRKPSFVSPYKTSSASSDEPQQEIYRLIGTLSPENQKNVLIRMMGTLSSRDKNQIAQVAGVRPLTQEATDFIWKIVITGGVVVFVGSAGAIIAAVFVGVNVAALITVFTGVVAFLGGLLAPSPVQNSMRSIASVLKPSPQEREQPE